MFTQIAQRWTLTLSLLAFAAVGLPGFASAAEPSGANPGVPELTVLSRFVGTWVAQLRNTDEEIRSKREWVLDGRFVKHEFDLSSGGVSGVIYRGYNQKSRKYTMTFLDSSGNASHLTGHWDEERKMLTFEASDRSMLVQKYESYFPDDKIEQWTISFNDNSGEISGTASKQAE